MTTFIKDIWADSKTRNFFLFFLIIVSLMLLLLIFQKNKMEEQLKLKIQFVEQKNMLRDELDDIIDEHDELLDEYGDLNNQLYQKDSIIKKQILEIKNLIRKKSETNLDLQEARKKIEALKTISKNYIANIDSLLVINEQLIEQKDSVININKNINWKNYKLIKQNKVLEEVVSKGSVLKIEDIEVEAIKYKSTGKEASTKYAKKTQKLSICFNISANQIAKAELKQAYIQILKPDGSILNGMEDIFIVVEDEQILCTTETEFNYKNIQMSHCLEWERLDVLESGFYTLIIFLEGKKSQQSVFKLK